MAKEDKPKKRGPKGGIKDTPGRGHRRKSDPVKKGRFRRKSAKEREQKEEEARKVWAKWDALTDEQRQLLGPEGEPKVARPKDED